MVGPFAIPATPQELLHAGLRANEGTPDPRTLEILATAIRHLHAFAFEVELSYAEWQHRVDFMVDIGRATGPEKHEGILLADILDLEIWRHRCY